MDDFNHVCFIGIFFLKSEDEMFSKFKEVKSFVENQKDKRSKVFRFDNGGELTSGAFEQFFKDSGIVHQKTNVYTPQQNGVAERFNRTIVGKAKCLLFDQNLGKSFWTEACKTACYLMNRSVSSTVSKTPYEIWHNKKPNLGHLTVFGSVAMVHVPKQRRRNWDRKAIKCILVGFDENIKGYRDYDPEKREIFNSRDVNIMEC